MGQTALTNRKVPADCVKWETDMRYCRAEGTLTGSLTMNDPVGFPAVYTEATGAVVPCTQSTQGDANCLILYPKKISLGATDTLKVPVLVRGPALFNQSSLPSADLADATFTISTIVAALKDENIRPLLEPTISKEQTT